MHSQVPICPPLRSTAMHRGFVAASGMTMVVVTHEMGFAREVANRVVFINEGRVQEDESPQEFFTNPKNPRLKDFLSKVL